MAETKKAKSAATADKKSPKGLRIAAIILWVLAIGFEIGAIYMINLRDETLVIVALVLDAICCITGSLLWKKSNRIKPCQSKSKFVCFIWNQLGVIACILAFIPFGIYLLLKADKLSDKAKKLILVVAIVLFAGSVGTSIDYNPPSAEELERAETAALATGEYTGTVYWTRFGKSFHLDPDCHTLSRTSPENLFSGTLEEAFAANRTDPCDFCASSMIEDDAEKAIDEVEAEEVEAVDETEDIEETSAE